MNEFEEEARAAAGGGFHSFITRLICGKCEKSFSLAVAPQGGERGAGGFPLAGTIVKPPYKGRYCFLHFR